LKNVSTQNEEAGREEIRKRYEKEIGQFQKMSDVVKKELKVLNRNDNLYYQRDYIMETVSQY
jgi:hypothetical protein